LSQLVAQKIQLVDAVPAKPQPLATVTTPSSVQLDVGCREMANANLREARATFNGSNGAVAAGLSKVAQTDDVYRP
jgi:hypothetical protein